MIVFAGVFSREVNKKMYTQSIKSLSIIMCIMLIVIYCLAALTYWGDTKEIVASIIFYGVITFIVYIFILLIAKQFDYTKISVSTDAIECVLANKTTKKIENRKIKYVVDKGNHYEIRLNNLILNKVIICDKLAIKKGSVQLFEKLYKDFLVKKL